MALHLLQSDQWEKFQKALGNSTLRIKSANNTLGIIERSHGRIGRHLSRLYIPYGPVASSSPRLKDMLAVIEHEARSHSLDALRIEPYGYDSPAELLSVSGYEKRPKSSQPDTTRIIHLESRTDDEVIAEMNATNRNLWRKNLSLGVDGIQFQVVTKASEAEVFYAMMHETSTRSGAVFHSDAYFRVMIDCFGSEDRGGVMIASKGGKDLAATLFVIEGTSKTLYYLHAGSTAEARQHNAGNVLVSNLIMYAKSIGMSQVDLYGVAPENAPDIHPLYGISRFKRAYGGVDVSYYGTWEKSLSTKHKLTKKALTTLRRTH